MYFSVASAFLKDRLNGIKIAHLFGVFLPLLICFSSVDMLNNEVLPILRNHHELRMMSKGAPANFERNVRHWMDTLFHSRRIEVVLQSLAQTEPGSHSVRFLLVGICEK